ncbi:TraR/DksA family transcriptional regulator, partial [Escherichia coli]|uniref:TraR/DksA family transcriptional regulator n=1 Tax=Escherichia coli TaxID=562 RepID=UPI0013A5BB45
SGSLVSRIPGAVHQAISATHCCECGDPIDERRRLAVQGCRTCASCQQDLELISKQRGST